jgi:hypothetical protein
MQPRRVWYSSVPYFDLCILHDGEINFNLHKPILVDPLSFSHLLSLHNLNPLSLEAEAAQRSPDFASSLIPLFRTDENLCRNASLTLHTYALCRLFSFFSIHKDE